jgi:hypothetical protein
VDESTRDMMQSVDIDPSDSTHIQKKMFDPVYNAQVTLTMLSVCFPWRALLTRRMETNLHLQHLHYDMNGRWNGT